MINKIIKNIKILLYAIVCLVTIINVSASTPPVTSFFTGKPFKYTVQLENSTQLNNRIWGIWIQEPGGNVGDASIRRVQENSFTAINPTATSYSMANASAVLTGTTPWFFLATYPGGVSYQSICPILSWPLLQAFRTKYPSNDTGQVDTDLSGLLNYYSVYFIPLQGSALDKIAAQLYGSLSYAGYYPEVSSTSSQGTGFNIALTLIPFGGTYPTYALGSL